MNSKNTNMFVQSNLTRTAMITIGILLIPAVAMQFTNEVKWDETDFIIIGALVFGFGYTIGMVLERVRNRTHRIGLSVALFLLLLYIWAELAVGIFTNWGS